MGENKRHRRMKEIAKDYLRDREFSDRQIYEEWVDNNTNYRIDVVGISSKGRIAIECGGCKQEKLDELEEYFDEVIHYQQGSEDTDLVLVDRHILKLAKLKKINLSKLLNEKLIGVLKLGGLSRDEIQELSLKEEMIVLQKEFDRLKVKLRDENIGNDAPPH